ncbi:hypothetical protein EGW08_013347 [Elysia chlorotica]|uniref:60S ribosomal protein L21 n=1 Tax=Elysia chlorotica TaxID=188477 RepID=A0A3S0ZHB3_ELYCH|nr:hypothetical protein EGW08_013347 [Elysia chlorotica]
MTNPKGYRRGTRYMFARNFRSKGVTKLSRYMQVFKRGDIVDIKGDGAIQKGMPYKFYHGKTGRIFNVTPHAVGVEVNKQVGRDEIEEQWRSLRLREKETCLTVLGKKTKKHKEWISTDNWTLILVITERKNLKHQTQDIEENVHYKRVTGRRTEMAEIAKTIKRKVGRAKPTWRRSTEVELKATSNTGAELKRTRQNRVRWRGVVATLRTTVNQEA